MKKITFLLAFFCFWQTYAQVVNQSAGLPNAASAAASSHIRNPFAFKANPTTTANAAFDNRVFGGGGCFNGGLYPEETYSASICDGTTVNLVAPDSYAGEYSNINVFDTSDYVFSSSNASDYITVASADGTTFLNFGVGSVNYSPAADGVVRVYFHTDGSCGGDEIPREKRVVCTTAVTVPDCASNPSPADGSITVPAFDTFDVSWLPPSIGEFASSYDVFTGTSSSSLVLYGNYTGPGIPDFGPIRDYNTTIYWKVVPKNAAGDALDCTTWSFTTEPQPEGSPECASNPSPADGSTVNAFATFDLSWNPPAGEPATSYDVYFGESIDSLTYDDNFTTTTLTNFGFYGYFDTTLYWKVVPKNAAGAAIGCSIWSIATGPQTTDTPDYVNLQYPPTITVTRGGSGTVYGQVYEGGLTDVAPNVNGQAPGIVAWVAISPLGENTDPSTWDPYDWVQATWNAGSTGNNDEYQATIGANLLPGTYYYATRFSLNNGPFVYGGYSPSGGSFWDGATYVNGVLTVTEAPVPGNDDCDGATALVVDDTYCNGTNTNGTNAGATDSGVAVPLCFNYGLNDVWYSFEAPINTTMVDVSTDFLGGTLYDTEVALYEGACGSLTEIACDQDGGIVTQPTGYSYNSLISDAPVTAGETYYVRVAGYSDFDFGSFCLKVSRKQELSNQDFNNTNLTHYPNPVKNILNLSYNQEISNVEVYNMLGQKVSATVIKANDAHIDMSNLSKGAYMVRVTSNDQVKTIKVIKE